MVNIAILDDEHKCVDEIRKCISEYTFTEDVIIDDYEYSKELFSSEKEYEIIVVDVELKENINGFEVIEKYRINNPDTLFIIVTTHEELTREGYKVNAFRYVFKSELADNMKEALDSAMKEVKRNVLIDIHLLRASVISVPIKNILYLETYKRNVLLHTVETEYLISDKITDLRKILEDKGFVCPHQSYIVNMEYIVHIDKGDLLLKNGNKIPVSRILRTQTKEKLFKWRLER